MPQERPDRIIGGHNGSRREESQAAEAARGAAGIAAARGAAGRAAARVGQARVWRGFAVGLALLPFNTLWVFYMEEVGGHGPFVSTISLFFNVIFILTFLALANLTVRRLRPALALNRAEMVIVYVMLTVSTSIMSHDMLQVLISMMTTGYWYATPQNRWELMLNGTTPSWLVISDQDVLYGYWNGNTTLYQGVVLEAWIRPMLWWLGFLVVLVFALICISVVFRPLWSDRERLTFPIIQLPLELTDPETALFRNPLMWIAFGIGAFVNILNGLAQIYPAVPSIPLYIDLASYIRNDPWTGSGWFPMTFNPSLIGLSFLMPLDLLFSCTFFYLYWKGMFVIARATGVSEGYGWGGPSTSLFPWSNEQMFGGFIAIALGSALLGRQYFRQVWQRVVGRPSEVDDSSEGLSFRVAFVGALIAVGLLVAFAIHGGLRPGLAAAFFAIYFLLAVAVARVRGEFGSPVHDFHFAGPDYTLAHLLGTVNLRQRDMGMFHQLYWFNRAYRAHPVASTIEGLQMSARLRFRGRPVVYAIMVAVVATVVTGFWGWLYCAYKLGATSGWGYGANWFGEEAYNRLQSWIENPKPANLTAPIAMAAGFAISLALAAARTRFVGWPLHPVAYALSASWSINWVWMPMLIAWVLKSAVLRYGGLRLYRRALPFFFGLILGECIPGVTWPLIGLVFHVPSYSFFGS